MNIADLDFKCIKVNTKLTEESESRFNVALFYTQDKSKRNLSVTIPGMSCRFSTNKTSVELDLNKNPDALDFVDTLDEAIFEIATGKWNKSKWYVDDNRITSPEVLRDLYKTLAQTKRRERQKVVVMCSKLSDKCAVLDADGNPVEDVEAALETLQTNENATATVVLVFKNVTLKNTSFSTCVECKSIQILDGHHVVGPHDSDDESDFEEVDEDDDAKFDAPQDQPKAVGKK